METPAVDVGAPSAVAKNEEAVRAESRRQKEEARVREAEERARLLKERNSWWNWIKGK
jgi:hypothetical protein